MQSHIAHSVQIHIYVSSTRWRHQVETFSALLAICVGNSPVPRKASDAELWYFFFNCARLNGRVNNREAGDLRRPRAQYDVIVM